MNAKATRDLVERLLRSHDAEELAEACQSFANTRATGVHVQWRAANTFGATSPQTPYVELTRDETNARVLIAHGFATSPTECGPIPWRWVGQLVQLRFQQQKSFADLSDTVARMEQTKRLQRALYNISDLATDPKDIPTMMRDLHAIISTLMYAENFYVALYDAEQETIRFPYFIDTAGDIPDDADKPCPLETWRYSLTWHLIQSRQPLMGNLESLAKQVTGPLNAGGTNCIDWLGVPLRHGSQVTGGLVVQSYREDAHFTTQDRDLLTYVAQHVQNVLDRFRSHKDLEETISRRTYALREANQVLQQQVLERQRGERLQASLFRIAELASSNDSLDKFYAAIHRIIGTLIYARNFYIALFDAEKGLLTFPYAVDETNELPHSRTTSRGFTEYVLRHGKPLLARPDKTKELIEQGEVKREGLHSLSWLGVPLTYNNEPKGVLAVQSYTTDHSYGPRDQELLTFVSYHVANALQRRYDNESLKQAYAHMEHRVTERTRALALANRDLRKQMAERERIERRLKYETLHDQLTGLPNRTLLLQRLEQAIQHYHADTTQLFAVLFVDLDRFKVINDSVGHLVGDDLLFQVGGRIRSCLKARDTVARLGGDEFAVLLNNIRSEQVAQEVAARIIETLHEPFHIGVKELFTSASIGITLASPGYHRAEELLRDSDSAMYSAKSAGRHRAETFDYRLRERALLVLEIEGDLRRGITRHEFIPYYQPVVRLIDGAVVGYETLVRWHHPTRGVLLPIDFLEVAEESGCMEDIDWQVFDQACHDAVSLVQDDVFISINVSARHFTSVDLNKRLLDLATSHGLSPDHLHLEVTEGTLLENPEQTKRTLAAFREHGVSIALDDFGTGYSSLSYIHQYPFQVIKIDQTFIVHLENPDNKHGKAVVSAILALASSLQIQVIAEGIENEAQRDILKRMGCGLGQGFLYAHAEPIEHWLNAGTHLFGPGVNESDLP